MNTKILFAIAGTAALSACSKNPKPEGWEFPLVEPERKAVHRPVVQAPRPTFEPGDDPFRVPDPTENLPTHQRQPGPKINVGPSPAPSDPNGPLSGVPNTPPPTPLRTPLETGAPVAPPSE